MKLITDSAEHHFLTMLDKLRDNTKDWAVYHFALSKLIDHKSLTSRPALIEKTLNEQFARSKEFAANLMRGASDIKNGFVYLFTDHDVLMLIQATDAGEQELAQKSYWEMAKPLPSGLAQTGMLADGFRHYQKLSDQKFLSSQRFAAYRAMTDENKVSSIRLRRERREEPVVMVIEDDRFTSAYTSNILSHRYDLAVARTGEEGIISYIERAPDIVFLDIHLPGLNGLETLQAIFAIDPQAYVVMLSVDASKDYIVQSRNIGAGQFLKKPFSNQRMLSIVQQSPHVRGIHKPLTASPMPASVSSLVSDAGEGQSTNIAH